MDWFWVIFKKNVRFCLWNIFILLFRYWRNLFDSVRRISCSVWKGVSFWSETEIDGQIDFGSVSNINWRTRTSEYYCRRMFEGIGKTFGSFFSWNDIPSWRRKVDSSFIQKQDSDRRLHRVENFSLRFENKKSQGNFQVNSFFCLCFLFSQKNFNLKAVSSYCLQCRRSRSETWETGPWMFYCHCPKIRRKSGTWKSFGFWRRSKWRWIRCRGRNASCDGPRFATGSKFLQKCDACFEFFGRIPAWNFWVAKILAKIQFCSLEFYYCWIKSFVFQNFCLNFVQRNWFHLFFKNRLWK